MLWSRRSPAAHERTRHAGLDLNASRVLGASLGSGKVRPLPLDGEADEVPLCIALDRHVPALGRAGYALCRKAPHAVCSNFVPFLAQAREWRAGRHVLTAESALELTFQRLRSHVLAESDAVVLALPSYLAPIQVSRLVQAAARCRFPLKGTTVAALAVAAARAATVAAGKPFAIEGTLREGVIPLPPVATGAGSVAVVDVDEFALSATVVLVERDAVRLLAADHWPRLCLKTWKDRLLDAVADRCIRLCRRDPRDSAAAEQSLFEQLDEALDRGRVGQGLSLTVRTDRWYQDMTQQPEDLDAHCAVLAGEAAESIRAAIDEAGLPAPPQAVWLTHEAARLPGLLRQVRQNSHEGTVHEILPRSAGADAAAALVARWLSADLPRAHLDGVISLPPVHNGDVSLEKPKTGRR